MIKRWVATRRKNWNLFARVSGLESKLRQASTDLGEFSQQTGEQAGRLQGVQASAQGLQAELAASRAEVAHLEERVTALAAALIYERSAWSELEHRVTAESNARALAEATVRSTLSAMAAIKPAVDGLAIRAARLETQRQVDVEESRQASLASLQELKRTVLDWRTDAALQRLDAAIPSRRYVSLPAEDQRPAAIRSALTAGTPFLKSGISGRVHAIALQPNGAVDLGQSVPALAPDSWIAFAPAGAVAAPDFAKIVLDQAERQPQARVLYADDLALDTDDAIDQIRRKPGFDVTLLAAQDYVGAPLMIRADALEALGGLDPTRGTAACADLLFRAYASGQIIGRIPQVLLAHPGRRVRATATDFKAMLEAQPMLVDYAIRQGLTPDSFGLERRFDPQTAPGVTLIIPTRRTAAPWVTDTYLERLLHSITRTDWPMDRLTVLVGDDVAEDAPWEHADWPFSLRRIPTPRGVGEPFNYAAKMNRLWSAADTEQIVFMNDDVRILDKGWLKALQTFAMDPRVGGVGARLLFEDGALQHAGMAPHQSGTTHLWVKRLGSQGAYQDWPLVHREWSMVTGAIFATRRSLMQAVAGFDEQFTLEFNDTDLCMRLRSAGYRIVYTPFAQLVHVERASRGGTPPPPRQAALFAERWAEWLADDPSWHPGLDLARIEVMPIHDPDAWYM